MNMANEINFKKPFITKRHLYRKHFNIDCFVPKELFLINLFTSLTSPNNKISDTKKSLKMFTGEQGGHRNSERQLLWAQDTDHQKM